jgi:hypothetical protein
MTRSTSLATRFVALLSCPVQRTFAMLDDLLGADPHVRAQREHAIMQLGHAYALVRLIGDMDATRIDDFVGNMLVTGAAEHIDAMLEHLDVASGAWRELAELADYAIECVAVR